MHGAPLPQPERDDELDDMLGDFTDEMAPDSGEDLEQAVRDVVFDAEYRDGFRLYSVSPENMRRLASLVDLDHVLEH